jgi:uncharacterized protein YjgD (DUF1641 family)
MAAPIDFAPPRHAPGQDAFTAYDDLDRLVQTLHTSGTLRLLNGFVAEFSGVMKVVLDGLDTEGGRNGLSNLLVLVKLLGKIEPDGLDRFVNGLDQALEAAGERLDAGDDAPGSLSVLKKLREPEVRRGLDAALTLLGTLGAQLHDPQPPVHSNQHEKTLPYGVTPAKQ